jgi:Tol biopolymer transport system component
MKYGKIMVTLTLVAAANSLATRFGPRYGTFSADGTKIAYVSGVTGDINIYTVNADGSGKVRFDLEHGLCGKPYFSPDGSKIAFINDGWWFLNGNVFLVEVDGTNLKPVTAYGDDPFEKDYRPRERAGVLDEGLTFSPDGRRILYCSEEFGSKDIFAVNVDGTGKTRLTDFAAYDVSGPVFLPGGEEIVFNVTGPGENSGIWIMNADGSAKKRLPLPANAELVAVSPDGKKIAYEERGKNEFATNESTTYVADLDGSSRFKVADEELRWLGLSFSPDGKKVLYCLDDAVYVVNADGSGRENLAPPWQSEAAFFAEGAEVAFVGTGRYYSAENIYTMGVDGSGLKAFSATKGMDVRDLVVSPTGERFLFKGDYYGGLHADYFVVNADGTGLARLTTWYSEYNPHGGKFSADGSKVAYLSNETGAYHIYTVNAGGSGKVRFDLKGGLWGEPYLSPDGKKVAFVNYYEFFQKGNIFLVDADGKNLTRVTAYSDGDDEITGDPDRGIGVLYDGLTFSPDGRKILYCSVEFGSKDIFAINVDGTGKTRLTDFANCEESGPVFLAGGDKVLFEVNDLAHDGIWIMNADGSAKEEVPVPGDARLVAVSPDGKKIIAFGDYPDEENGFGSATYATYVAGLDGSRRFKVADGRPSQLELSLSPDGKKVLYCLDDAVYVVNADGSGRKALTPGCDFVHSPAFFREGTKIAFIGRCYPYPNRSNIWTMYADGSDLKPFKATEGMDVRKLIVSPTGDRFLVEGDYYGEVTPGYFVVNADGSSLVEVSAYKPPPPDETEE